MTKKTILFFLLIFSLCSSAQIKKFDTFTLISNGEGIDVKDNVILNIGQNSLSLISKNFTFENAKKTGRNEMYNDSVKGDILATQYKTTYYEIVLMRYVNYPNEVYLKIIDLQDYTNYLIIVAFFVINISFSQNQKNEGKLNEIQQKTFVDLVNILCEDIGKKHTYINKLKVFKMIDEEESSVTTYKYLSQDYNFFISVLNEYNGLRFNSPNSFLYDIIVSKGTFKEVHKEGNTSFLVYELLGNSFLINFNTDNKGRKHYLIDTYCIQ